MPGPGHAGPEERKEVVQSLHYQARAGAAGLMAVGQVVEDGAEVNAVAGWKVGEGAEVKVEARDDVCEEAEVEAGVGKEVWVGGGEESEG